MFSKKQSSIIKIIIFSLALIFFVVTLFIIFSRNRESANTETDYKNEFPEQNLSSSINPFQTNKSSEENYQSEVNNQSTDKSSSSFRSATTSSNNQSIDKSKSSSSEITQSLNNRGDYEDFKDAYKI